MEPIVFFGYVIIAQGISGIAKDLTKVSAKSAIKTIVSDENKNRRLFKLVSFLTGSKNTLKGVGFFLGSLSLSLLGYKEWKNYKNLWSFK